VAQSTKSERVPKLMQETFDAVVARTDAFCRAHLDEEYAQLARAAAAALCRKRPSPLTKGSVDTWACGIVHALGMVNFLFDKSQVPHLSAEEIYERFGVSKSSGSAKSRAVRDALRMSQMDPQWYRPSRLKDNPLVWLIMVDGLIVDARRMPLAIQQQAYEQGLIPYVPGAKG
jgi:uncharacterized protein DUF6398